MTKYCTLEEALDFDGTTVIDYIDNFNGTITNIKTGLMWQA